ncbi:MAG: radical SAM protein [Candidatus Aenigmatarchaeota archaeon]
MKALRGTPKHLSRAGQLDGFTYLMINLPFECNYRCSKCFNIEENKAVVSEDFISVEEMFGVIREAREMNGKVAVVAGEGEPSLNKIIRRIVSQINSVGMIPIIYSNGFALTPDLIEFYRDNNASLVISFDSLNSEVYNKLTGTKRQLGKVVENIRRATDAYSRTIETVGDVKLVRIAINTTVTSLNEGEISAIRDFFGDDIYFICNPLAKLGNGARNWTDLIASDSDYERHKHLVVELSESGGPLTLGSDGLCGYSAWGIGISPGGDYMTCAYTRKTDGLLGNVKNRSLRDAFEYKHAMESRHHKSNGPVPCLVRSPRFDDYLKELAVLT